MLTTNDDGMLVPRDTRGGIQFTFEAVILWVGMTVGGDGLTVEQLRIAAANFRPYTPVTVQFDERAIIGRADRVELRADGRELWVIGVLGIAPGVQTYDDGRIKLLAVSLVLPRGEPR